MVVNEVIKAAETAGMFSRSAQNLMEQLNAEGICSSSWFMKGKEPT